MFANISLVFFVGSGVGIIDGEFRSEFFFKEMFTNISLVSFVGSGIGMIDGEFRSYYTSNFLLFFLRNVY